jgi:hypothetical protein
MSLYRTIKRRGLIAGLAIGAAAPCLACRAGEPTAGRTGGEQGDIDMKVEFAFADQVFTATLNDHPPARDFASMLPLALRIDDFSSNEKIAVLPRQLDTRGAPSYSAGQSGDLCYYAPWRNLALFYDDYAASPDVIRLGRLDGSVDPLRKKGAFALRVTKRP